MSSLVRFSTFSMISSAPGTARLPEMKSFCMSMTRRVRRGEKILLSQWMVCPLSSNCFMMGSTSSYNNSLVRALRTGDCGQFSLYLIQMELQHHSLQGVAHTGAVLVPLGQDG